MHACISYGDWASSTAEVAADESVWRGLGECLRLLPCNLSELSADGDATTCTEGLVYVPGLSMWRSHRFCYCVLANYWPPHDCQAR